MRATVRFRAGRIGRRPLDLLPAMQALPRRKRHQLRPPDRDRRAHRTPPLRARPPRKRRSRLRHDGMRCRAPDVRHRDPQSRQHPPPHPRRSRRAETAIPVKRGPLDGIVVADFSRVLAGPLCTQMLADFGARVIKVEDPRGGDETRRWGPPFADGVSTYYQSVNRAKESITIDLVRGKDVVARLLELAD